MSVLSCVMQDANATCLARLVDFRTKLRVGLEKRSFSPGKPVVREQAYCARKMPRIWLGKRQTRWLGDLPG